MSRGFHPFGGRVSRHFGDRLAPDDGYLSYYDSRLTKADVEAIKDDWLPDNAISFYEEFLEHEKLSAYPRAKITLLRPSMAFLLAMDVNRDSIRDALPDITGSTHIFLPVNDETNTRRENGGTHWSLLVVSVIDGLAFHYDSLSPANHRVACACADKLAWYLNRAVQFQEMADFPRQNNGSDCGVYVCMAMKTLLLKRLLTSDSNRQVGMSLAGANLNADAFRKYLIDLVDDFRRQGLRSRSRSGSPVRQGSPPRVGG